jgi:hypothetical protein
MNNSEILIYQNSEGNIKIDVRLEEESVWLTQAQLCELFLKSKATISEHIKNVFEEGELDEEVVVRKFRTTTQHGAMAGKTQESEVNGYNLDVIISCRILPPSIRQKKELNTVTQTVCSNIIHSCKEEFTSRQRYLKLLRHNRSSLAV